jgi:hypothetical protein
MLLENRHSSFSLLNSAVPTHGPHLRVRNTMLSTAFIGFFISLM